MSISLSDLKNNFNSKLQTLQSESELKDLQEEYLGKKWLLKWILAGIKDLSNEEKKTIGVESNMLKEYILQELQKKSAEIQALKIQAQIESETLDVTAEFPSSSLGHKHPISITTELLEDIFISLGFKIEDGPQIETEKFNFDMLNIPDNHPARDVWDTFWISDNINSDRKPGDKYLLRTHTSPVQVRTMLREELPIKIIVPGRVFRYEQEDARHTCNFYQLEGLVVGEGVTFGDLKWTLDTAMKSLLGDQTQTRFRPSIFPFTEPSAEVDVSCQICSGSGKIAEKNCSMCSGTGWVELLGSGMVHPVVLEWCSIDPEKYSGFAFGMGIDRIAAQRFGVSSSRAFYQSKLKLNEQF